VYHLFIDESGEFGTKPGSSRHFLIAALCTENPKALDKRVWKHKAILYNAGWPRSIEIKGTTLWGSDHNPRIPTAISSKRVEIIKDVISSICASSIKLHYSIARKERLTPRLLNAEYGIAYNYLSGCLLCRAYKAHYPGPLTLIVDQRSKETHTKNKFDGYIETRLFDECEHCTPISISHEESHNVLGLQAVDFLSWGLFRHYEHNDSQFQKIIAPSVGYKDDWYSGK